MGSIQRRIGLALRCAEFRLRRRQSRDAFAPPLAQDLKPGPPRQTKIENDQIVRLADALIGSIAPIG